MKLITRILTIGAAATVSVLASASFASAQTANEITITIEPTDSSVVLGENLDLAVTVSNNGSAATVPLVVHLDITDPGLSTSVDPEDWTATLTKELGVIGAGDSATAEWTIQPISSGGFSVYAVTLSPGADTTTVSNVLQVSVADQRSLNPGGILPVAIGAPVVVGGLLLVQLRLARRTRKRPAGLAFA